jgi:hypothetical protein
MEKKTYEKPKISLEKNVDVITTSPFKDDDALDWDTTAVSYGVEVDYSSFRLD